ncbi:MAG TPA: metallophosphoesterase [Thermoleophilaceae bacterium]|nr:metallophosphoesterase [Thermoleophilaceae bacterium]
MIPVAHAAAGLGVAALGFRTFWWEPRRVQRSEETLELPGWPPKLSGFRVGVIADLHVGAPHVPLAQVDRLVAWMNEQRPDLVVLLGDYASPRVLGGRRVPPGPVAASLGKLRAPRSVYAVLGNHDWWVHGRAMGDALTAAGIRVLENEAERTGQVWVAGLADLREREPSIGEAFGAIPEGEPVLALSHDPDLFPFIPDRVALTLSGHTHGNQVNVPVLRNLVTPSHFGTRYGGGHVVEEGRHLFVSRGVGTSTLPGRFRAPPEVSVLELQSAS